MVRRGTNLAHRTRVGAGVCAQGRNPRQRREGILNADLDLRWITQCVDRGADRLCPSNVDVDAGTHADHNRN